MSECISEIYFLIVRILNREYFFCLFLCFGILVAPYKLGLQKKRILVVAGVTGKKQTNKLTN